MKAELVLDQVSLKTSSPDGGRRIVLKDISLNYRTDERVGLIGRSGSGKTSLARVIARLDRPTRGKLLIRPKQARIMLVLQRPEDHFIAQTVGQQIACYAAGRLSRVMIHSVMTKVSLPLALEGYPPIHLSGGQQRLLAIACSLVAEASMIVLDEPMAGLDGRSRRLVMQVLRDLRRDQDLGFIIISHHPDDLLGLVDRLWIMDEGKLHYDGLFHQAPVSLLSKCLSADDVSMYYILRRLESRGISLPESAYWDSTPEEIARLLKGTQIR